MSVDAVTIRSTPPAGRRRAGRDRSGRARSISLSVHPRRPTTHIRLDDEGVAWVDDTGVKVIEIVLEKIAHGWSPEEIHFQHRDLSLAQIHAGLSWYYDHRLELDAEIARRLEQVEQAAHDAVDSPLRARLRRTGHLG